MRADSLAFEPVFVSAAILPSDVGILTTTNQSSKYYKTDTTDVVYNLDSICYIFFALISVIVSVTIAGTPSPENDHKRNRAWNVLTQFKRALWDIISLIVDQENGKSKNWTIRVIWSTFNIGCFVLIFGYFWNLLSTEQSVKKELPAVDSLKDLLYDKQFNHIYPMLSKMLFLYNVLVRVPPSSDEGKLFQRMLQLGNTSIVESDAAGGLAAMTSGPLKVVVDDLTAGKAALLSIAWAIELLELLAPKIVDLATINNRKFCLAKQTFLQGTFNMFYSKKIHPNVRDYMDLR